MQKKCKKNKGKIKKKWVEFDLELDRLDFNSIRLVYVLAKLINKIMLIFLKQQFILLYNTGTYYYARFLKVYLKLFL